jgi:anti-sigma B factor antagonist
MEMTITEIKGVKVVQIEGDIDSSNASDVQERIHALIEPEVKILLDMSGIGFMSSAGLRMLLFLYRQVSSGGGKVVLTGLQDEIEETMELTGFKGFFEIYETQESGLAAF